MIALAVVILTAIGKPCDTSVTSDSYEQSCRRVTFLNRSLAGTPMKALAPSNRNSQLSCNFAVVRTTACVLCFVMWLSISAAAQAPPATKPELWPIGGQWDISIWGSAAIGYEHIRSLSDGQISTAGFTIARVISDEIGPGWCRGRLQYGFSLVPVLAVSAPQKFLGGGFDPVVLRWNLDKRGRVAPYAEASGGAIITTHTFPYGDSSNFNFGFGVGPGIQVAAGKRQALDLGVRYRHYSNAFLGTYNPSFNGVQFLVGFHWFK